MSLLLLFAGAGISASQLDDGYHETWMDARRRHEHQLQAIAYAERMRLKNLHAEVQMGIERRARESFARLQAEQARKNALRNKLKGN